MIPCGRAANPCARVDHGPHILGNVILHISICDANMGHSWLCWFLKTLRGCAPMDLRHRTHSVIIHPSMAVTTSCLRPVTCVDKHRPIHKPNSEPKAIKKPFPPQTPENVKSGKNTANFKAPPDRPQSGTTVLAAVKAYIFLLRVFFFLFSSNRKVAQVRDE